MEPLKVATRENTSPGIVPSLMSLAVPIDRVKPDPRNPRRGDVDAVARSYARFGQRKPIVARKTGGSSRAPTGVVVAGNHQLLAAIQLGWAQIAVVWVDEDEKVSAAYGLADNRTSDLAVYDDNALAELLAELDPELLTAASWEAPDIESILQPPGGSTDPQLSGVTYAVMIKCSTEADQAALLDRMRHEGFDAMPLMV